MTALIVVPSINTESFHGCRLNLSFWSILQLKLNRNWWKLLYMWPEFRGLYPCICSVQRSSGHLCQFSLQHKNIQVCQNPSDPLLSRSYLFTSNCYIIVPYRYNLNSFSHLRGKQSCRPDDEILGKWSKNILITHKQGFIFLNI